jgi:hypothetical protein
MTILPRGNFVSSRRKFLQHAGVFAGGAGAVPGVGRQVRRIASPLKLGVWDHGRWIDGH